jgi:hypothetical protein
VLPGSNGRLDQAYVPTPDGLRMEILEDKSQAMPIRSEQVHLFVPEAEIAKAQICSRRPSAARLAPATTSRSLTSRAFKSGLPRLTQRRRRPRAMCSTTTAST